MDTWQSQLYKRVKDFTDESFDSDAPAVYISIGHHEAYVIMKALEDQQRHLHPLQVIKDDTKLGPRMVPATGLAHDR